jgi:AraC-like DNA-binding protein
MSSKPLRRSPSVAAFVERPTRSYLAGDGFAVLSPSRALSAFAMWGNPSAQAIRTAVHAMTVDRRRDVPYVSFADSTGLTGASEEAFSALLLGIVEQTPIVARYVKKQAIVRPRGLLGSVATGFWAMVAAPFPVRVFEEPAEAWEWLGPASDPDRAEVERVIELHATVPAWLARLRAVLDAGEEQRLTGSARATGISARSLQRLLLDASTSFREELGASRLRRARPLLAAPGATLAEVAARLGCTPQTLRGLLRRTGDAAS